MDSVSAGCDCGGCGAIEEEDVFVVVDSTLLLSIRVESNSLLTSILNDEYVVGYVVADNTEPYSFIFVGDSGSMHSVSMGVALLSLHGGGSVKFIRR